MNLLMLMCFFFLKMMLRYFCFENHDEYVDLILFLGKISSLTVDLMVPLAKMVIFR